MLCMHNIHREGPSGPMVETGSPRMLPDGWSSTVGLSGFISPSRTDLNPPPKWWKGVACAEACQRNRARFDLRGHLHQLCSCRAPEATGSNGADAGWELQNRGSPMQPSSRECLRLGDSRERDGQELD